jgi:hypothetical protein
MSLSESDLDLLLKQEVELTTHQRNRLVEIIEAAQEGLFGQRGYAFTPPERIRERFGRTLPQNYPEASPAFLHFATSSLNSRPQASSSRLQGLSGFQRLIGSRLNDRFCRPQEHGP